MAGSSVSQSPSYDPVAKFTHWLVFALVGVQIIAGWSLPADDADWEASTAVNTHMTVGITILLLMAFRFWRRQTHYVPPLSTLPKWQQVLSHTVHLLLYAVLIVMPILGWGTAANMGLRVWFLGIIPLPAAPIAPGSATGEFFEEAHEMGASIVLLLVGLHAAAALYHYILRRDAVMQRMLPGG